MGADFLLAVLDIRAGVKPDWAVGLRHISRLEATPLAKWPDYLRDKDADPKEEAGNLKEALEDVRQAWEDCHRQGALLDFPGVRVLMAGGMSWGDTPSELYESINLLWDSKVAEACGFGSGGCDFCKKGRGKHVLLVCAECAGRIDPKKMAAKAFALKARG